MRLKADGVENMDVSTITIILTEKDAETLHRLLLNEGDYHSQDGDLDDYLSAIESFLEQAKGLFTELPTLPSAPLMEVDDHLLIDSRGVVRAISGNSDFWDMEGEPTLSCNLDPSDAYVVAVVTEVHVEAMR